MARINLDYRANSTERPKKASQPKSRINLDYRAKPPAKRPLFTTKEEFLAGWDLDRIYEFWHKALQKAAPGAKFEVSHREPSPNAAKRHTLKANQPFFVWASKDESDKTWRTLADLETALQTNTFRLRNWEPLKGAWITMDDLWCVRDQPKMVATLLLAASLFERIGSTRGQFPKETWPHGPFVYGLNQLLLEELEKAGPLGCWERFHTSVLPPVEDSWRREEEGPKMETMEELLTFLAEEHAEILTNYAFVAIYEGAEEKEPVAA